MDQSGKCGQLEKRSDSTGRLRIDQPPAPDDQLMEGGVRVEKESRMTPRLLA